jgi:hypothetical protein
VLLLWLLDEVTPLLESLDPLDSLEAELEEEREERLEPELPELPELDELPEDLVLDSVDNSLCVEWLALELLLLVDWLVREVLESELSLESLEAELPDDCVDWVDGEDEREDLLLPELAELTELAELAELWLWLEEELLDEVLLLDEVDWVDGDEDWLVDELELFEDRVEGLEALCVLSELPLDWLDRLEGVL